MNVITDTIRHGVDTERLFATLDLIKAQPELAKFQFRATNRWINGAHNRSTIKDFYAAGGEDTSRSEEFQIDAGEPAILLGTDTGANPTEYLLHALRLRRELPWAPSRHRGPGGWFGRLSRWAEHRPQHDHPRVGRHRRLPRRPRLVRPAPRATNGCRGDWQHLSGSGMSGL